MSTIADTWIHLSYVVQSGERNRALTIVILMGSLRWEKEEEERERSAGLIRHHTELQELRGADSSTKSNKDSIED